MGDFEKCSRRSILKLGILAGGSASVGSVNILAAAEQNASLTNKTLLSFSSALTGFKQLKRRFLPVLYKDLKQGYGQARVDDLLARFENVTESEQETFIRDQVMPSDDFEIAKRVILFWYNGVLQFSEAPQKVLVDMYYESKVWQAAGLKPKGVPIGRTWDQPLS